MLKSSILLNLLRYCECKFYEVVAILIFKKMLQIFLRLGFKDEDLDPYPRLIISDPDPRNQICNYGFRGTPIRNTTMHYIQKLSLSFDDFLKFEFWIRRVKIQNNLKGLILIGTILFIQVSEHEFNVPNWIKRLIHVKWRTFINCIA